MDAEDRALIEHAAANLGENVEVVVNGCAYSCCGKGWRRRDGYEQTYVGYVDNLSPEAPMTFMLYSVGLGTISYVCAIREDEVLDVRPVGSSVRSGTAR